MPEMYQNPAYKNWAQAEDGELQQRAKTGDYGLMDSLVDGVKMLPQKGAAWIADQDASAINMYGPQGNHVTASDARQGLLDRMRQVADKQHQGQPLTDGDKRAQGDWNTMKANGSVWMLMPSK